MEMPDYRLTPRREGYSDQITSLNDLTYRVWQQYKASADDYGVMPDEPSMIRVGNRRLKRVSERVIRVCLDEIVGVALLHRFMHQQQAYLYSRDWQDHQKIRYPSETLWPPPPTDELAQCSDKTRALFEQRFVNTSEVVAQTFGKGAEPPARGGALNANATANAKDLDLDLDLRGESERGPVPGPLVVPPGRNIAVHGRVPLPASLLAEFVAKRGGDPVTAADEIRAWAGRVLDRFSADETIPGSADNFAFWRQKAAEELFGPAAPTTRQQRVSAANQATLQRALKRKADA